MEKPPRYEILGQEGKVCKLNKALYGLNQSPRAWYIRIDSYLFQNGFNMQRAYCIPRWMRKVRFELFVCMLMTWFSNSFNWFVQMRHGKWILNEWCRSHEVFPWYWSEYGIEVNQSDNCIFISQSKYANDIWRGLTWKIVNKLDNTNCHTTRIK